jgi:hypothetical protein
MNLIEALKSERPFRRKAWVEEYPETPWLKWDPSRQDPQAVTAIPSTVGGGRVTGGYYPLGYVDIIADDYEIRLENVNASAQES